MKNKNIVLALIITLFLAGLFLPSVKPIFARQEQKQNQPESKRFGVKNPMTDTFDTSKTPGEFFGDILKAALGIVGVISLIIFIKGGFVWMTAGGNEEKVKQGRDTLLWAVLALAVIFSAYAILHLIISTLMGSVYQQ